MSRCDENGRRTTVVCADCGSEYAASRKDCDCCDSTTRLTGRCTIVVTLIVAGDPDDATTALDQALDEGLLQDFLNDHGLEDVGRLRVLSTLAKLESEDT